MPLMDDSDIQVQLPQDKLNIDDIPDDKANMQRDAERIIVAKLAGFLESTTINSWTTPEDTPDIIRAIGGRLAASLIYRVRYSEDALDDPEFASFKYNEAMSMLEGIIEGNIVIVDPDTGEPITDPTSDFTNEFFTPNSTSDPPNFTMADRY